MILLYRELQQIRNCDKKKKTIFRMNITYETLADCCKLYGNDVGAQ